MLERESQDRLSFMAVGGVALYSGVFLSDTKITSSVRSVRMG